MCAPGASPRNFAIGTRRALGADGADLTVTSAADHRVGEARIRTLSVSLLAVAAVAASLILTKTREDELPSLPHAGENQPIRLPLDALRAAGM